MPALTSFPPIWASGARVLVLGTLPGAASLAAGEYYAHPRNLFWNLMGEFFDAGRAWPYAIRARRLARAGVAVWDVVGRGRRRGSLDADIEAESIVPNDLAGLLARSPRIGVVFFNGQPAARLFYRLVWPHLRRKIARPLEMKILPSTSPANASWSYARKRAAWRAVPTAICVAFHPQNGIVYGRNNRRRGT